MYLEQWLDFGGAAPARPAVGGGGVYFFARPTCAVPSASQPVAISLSVRWLPHGFWFVLAPLHGAYRRGTIADCSMPVSAPRTAVVEGSVAHITFPQSLFRLRWATTIRMQLSQQRVCRSFVERPQPPAAARSGPPPARGRHGHAWHSVAGHVVC